MLIKNDKEKYIQHQNEFSQSYKKKRSDSKFLVFHLRTQILTVYPNPAKEFVNFIFLLPKDANAVLRIKDYNGKTVQEFDILSNNSTIEWNTSQIPAGIYFYQLSTSDEIFESGKIVIIK